MRMKFGKQEVWILLVVAVAVAVEGSIFVKRSLLKPRLPEPCFTCRAEDRPFAYPLIAFMGRIKDMLVRGLTALADSRREIR